MAVLQSGKSGLTPSEAPSSSSSAQNEEVVPTYEEATTSNPPPVINPNPKATGNSNNNEPADESRRLYPFPSLGTTRDGYGQSPYQSDGTLRIPIAATAANARTSNGNPGGDSSLPFPGSQSRRGPRAGRRFCVAFFWAVILYMCMITIYTALDDNYGPPSHRHPHPSPPGWHHHHPSHDQRPEKGGKGGHHKEKRSFGISSFKQQ